MSLHQFNTGNNGVVTPVNYTVKVAYIVTHPVDRLGGKLIGSIVLNQ